MRNISEAVISQETSALSNRIEINLPLSQVEIKRMQETGLILVVTSIPDGDEAKSSIGGLGASTIAKALQTHLNHLKPNSTVLYQTGLEWRLLAREKGYPSEEDFKIFRASLDQQTAIDYDHQIDGSIRDKAVASLQEGNIVIIDSKIFGALNPPTNTNHPNALPVLIIGVTATKDVSSKRVLHRLIENHEVIVRVVDNELVLFRVNPNNGLETLITIEDIIADNEARVVKDIEYISRSYDRQIPFVYGPDLMTSISHLIVHNNIDGQQDKLAQQIIYTIISATPELKPILQGRSQSL